MDPLPPLWLAQYRGGKGIPVLIRRGGAEKAGRMDQGPILGRQPPGVGGQMKFRVPSQERVYLSFIFCRFGGAGDIEELAAGF